MVLLEHRFPSEDDFFSCSYAFFSIRLYSFNSTEISTFNSLTAIGNILANFPMILRASFSDISFLLAWTKSCAGPRCLLQSTHVSVGDRIIERHIVQRYCKAPSGAVQVKIRWILWLGPNSPSSATAVRQVLQNHDQSPDYSHERFPGLASLSRPHPGSIVSLGSLPFVFRGILRYHPQLSNSIMCSLCSGRVMKAPLAHYPQWCDRARRGPWLIARQSSANRR